MCASTQFLIEAACVKSVRDISAESKNCIIMLYVCGILYLLVGIYLHEVISQEFGTKKSPWFVFQICRRPKPK